MWAIRNETRYAAEQSFVRDRDGAELWIVVVRATFDIKREGPPEPAAIQPAVVLAPLFIGAPATTSLRYDSDLVRTKLGTDVVLHGCVYAPAGLGPIPCHWLARARLAGTYDAAWQQDRQPLVPDDFQDTYFQCAPTDQRAPGFLRGGEQVILRNLTPDGELRFQLPRLSIGFRTRIAGSTVDHRGQLHTVIIEPDTLRLIMVWHTALPCHHTLYTLKETVVFEEERIAGEGARTRREPLSAT